MRRLSFRLTVALFMFVIGLTAASLWFPLRRPSPPDGKAEISIPLQAPVTQQRTYRSAGPAGKCATKDGFPCSFTSFESSDGMSFSQMSETYNSHGRANKELQRRLEDASEIIKRESLFNEQGKQKGEKVVATFPPDARYKGAAEILWTDGPRLVYISGSSLRTILEYEKDTRWQ